ncbi:MAG: hypothetical protein QF773_11770, partial [Lentisphaeria bacterium]|nr:hypothetical protein [Lentisphaeria bacterium]
MLPARALVENNYLDGIRWALNKIAIRDTDILGPGNTTTAAPAVIVGRLDSPYVKKIVRQQK